MVGLEITWHLHGAEHEADSGSSGERYICQHDVASHCAQEGSGSVLGTVSSLKSSQALAQRPRGGGTVLGVFQSRTSQRAAQGWVGDPDLLKVGFPVCLFLVAIQEILPELCSSFQTPASHLSLLLILFDLPLSKEPKPS